jgi:Abnormal spindle-like microcephaly-assoc'd, ASPM-SPD-2-Hydin
MNEMRLRLQYQVLVLFVCSAIAWVAGCAGFAEPLPSLSVTPNVLSVSAKVGTSSTQAVNVTNIGTGPVSVKQAIVTGAGFTMSGLTTPMTLSPNQTQTFTVKFSAATTGSVSGSVAIMTDAAHRPVVMSLKGSATTASPNVASVSVTPSVASPAPNAKVQFTASVQGSTTNEAVTWKATTGAITAAGVYTAPASAATGTVTATSIADPTKVGSATIAVAASPTNNPPAGSVVTAVTVSPATASSATGGTLPFTASVQGSTANKAVTWKAALGTFSAAGVYKAPAKAGTDTVTATSVADASKSGAATVTVTAAPSNPPPSQPSVSSVTISPTSATATTGTTLQFSATVSGSATDKSVSWTAALGSINSAGLYTAPSSATTDTVTATSDADSSKSTSAQVKVNAVSAKPGAVAAFPSAQGGGAAAVGGRSGAIMEVTNRNDSGTGSLRACIQASGPRTCIFRVAGIITPLSRMQVSNPYLTIACQSAPGEVIIGGPNQTDESLFISTHDVVVRYCTFSADNPNVLSGPGTGTMNIEIANGDTHEIVFDHVTSRWAGNKEFAIVNNYVGPTNNITVQWSLFYEPSAGHPVGPGNAGPLVSPASGNDFHHNMFVNFSHRLPESTFIGHWTNNITYNWLFYAFSRTGTVDLVGNKWITGNLNAMGAQPHPIHADNVDDQYPGNPSYYLSGNLAMGDATPNADQWAYANQVTGENGSEMGPMPNGWRRSSPLPASEFPIAVDSVGNLDDVMLPTIGNSHHLDCTGSWVSHRDAADTRIVNQYKNKSAGGFWPNGLTSPITNQSSASQIPTPQTNWTDQPITNFSACTESMHDGIPDQWKTLKGLSTTDPNVYKQTAPNGYTWLDNYLDGQ